MRRCIWSRNSAAISQSDEKEDVALISSKMSLFSSVQRAAARQRRQTVGFTPIIARHGWLSKFHRSLSSTPPRRRIYALIWVPGASNGGHARAWKLILKNYNPRASPRRLAAIVFSTTRPARLIASRSRPHPLFWFRTLVPMHASNDFPILSYIV